MHDAQSVDGGVGGFIGRGVNQHGTQFGERWSRVVEHEQAGLAGDSENHFVGQFQIAACFEMFLRDEVGELLVQLGLKVGGQA